MKEKRKDSFCPINEKESIDKEQSTAASIGEGDGNRNGEPNLTMSEQVDELIDHCIEIESNKRMMRENVKWFTLTFKTSSMESKVLTIN